MRSCRKISERIAGRCAPEQKAEAERLSAEALEKLAGGSFNPGQKVCIYPLSAKLALEGKLGHDEEKLKKSLLPEL